VKPALAEKPDIVLAPPPGAGSWRLLATALSSAQDCLTLVKPRVSILVLVTVAAGFVLGAAEAGAAIDPWALAAALLGTALVAGGAAALNQLIEKEHDGRMPRTRLRPLPAGRLAPAAALRLGGLLAATGLVLLAVRANLLAAAIALLSLAGYVLVYTPLKRKTHLSTLAGAVPGALPPLIGWAAAAGEIAPPAWAVFGILFFWQLPHFLAIAWLYRDDYAQAGFPMLTVVDPSGFAAARQALSASVALLFASLLPSLVGPASDLYFWSALGLGTAFLSLSAWLAAARSAPSARAVILGSIIYLPAILVILVLDRAV
jgi:protoheme IX farnesyltransferase